MSQPVERLELHSLKLNGDAIGALSAMVGALHNLRELEVHGDVFPISTQPLFDAVRASRIRKLIADISFVEEDEGEEDGQITRDLALGNLEKLDLQFGRALANESVARELGETLPSLHSEPGQSIQDHLSC